MSYKLLVKDRNGEREVLLVRTVAIGRDPRCDVSGTDPMLSRRHAEFVVVGRRVVVRDLKSRNGILVNGRRTSEAVLGPGDVVQVAQMTVTLLASLGPAPDEPPVEIGLADEATSLLNEGQLLAVAASSAGRKSSAAGGSGSGANSRAWSIQLVGVDDRTTKVGPPPRLPVPPPGCQATSRGAPSPAAAETVADDEARAIAGGGSVKPAMWIAAALACVAVGVASTLLWMWTRGGGTGAGEGIVAIGVLLVVALAVAAGGALAAGHRGAPRRDVPEGMPARGQAQTRG